MTRTDTEMNRALLRSVLVHHACGHRYTHLVPVVFDEAQDLLKAVEFLEVSPCPTCLLVEQGFVPILSEQQSSVAIM